jgi:hypothetical protein
VLQNTLLNWTHPTHRSETNLCSVVAFIHASSPSEVTDDGGDSLLLDTVPLEIHTGKYPTGVPKVVGRSQQAHVPTDTFRTWHATSQSSICHNIAQPLTQPLSVEAKWKQCLTYEQFNTSTDQGQDQLTAHTEFTGGLRPRISLARSSSSPPGPTPLP